MVKCFVTGATGFIGSHITRLLTEKGHEVDVLVRKTSSLDLIDGLPVTTTTGDITDSDSLLAGISDDTEWLFHNAARMSDWGAKLRQWPINVGGTRNALEAARKKDVERFIYTSSTALYGFSEEVMDEESPRKPYQAYQESKLAAEDLVWEYSREYGLKATAVRPPSVVGHGDMYTGPQLINALKSGLWVYFGDGSNHQSFVHGEDVASLLILAAEKFDIAQGNAYNVASFVTEMKTLIEALADEIGIPKNFRRIPYRLAWGVGKTAESLYKAFNRKNSPILTSFRVKLFGLNYCVNDSKARKELGYKPRWDFSSTVKDMVAWGGEYKPR
ncbi:MAG: NAD-dependent epimerase/dehydratase family protein [Candidatus Thorarchaeota archaeon]